MQGMSLGSSYGSSFITEAAPPVALLLGSVLPGLVIFGKRRRG